MEDETTERAFLIIINHLLRELARKSVESFFFCDSLKESFGG